MYRFWIYKRYNRRIFLALLFWLFAAKARSTNGKISKIATVKCDWCWVGAVTNNSITVKAKLNNKAIAGKNYIQIFYHQSSNLNPNNSAVNKAQATLLNNKIATFNLINLTADTTYYYVIVADGRRYPSQGTLQFKTVKINQPYNFAIACSSCAGGTISQFSGLGVSNSKVFDLIYQSKSPTKAGRDGNLAMFIHMGDLHYRNDFPGVGSRENHLDDYRHNYDLVMNQARQRNLYQNVPLAYIWDDHDYGTNDADGSYPLKDIASKAYREQVPHYPLSDPGAVYQSFIVGRVRFILTDSRFYQDPIKAADINKSLLGSEQRTWLLNQLSEGKKQQQNNQEGLIIWVNSIPWIAQKNDAKTSSWNKFSQERTKIANFIKENNINKLLMLSGDAHMLAIDDGTAGTANSYATGGGGSFPVIQASSLDSRGSFKGGPYNGEQYIINSTVKSINGAIKGKGQWGLLNFIDDGRQIEVAVELKRMNQTLIKHNFIFDCLGQSARLRESLAFHK